ncbi:hypothetical protein ACOMHN_028275 [Nucella lapillus]
MAERSVERCPRQRGVWRGVHDKEECGEVSMTERSVERCPWQRGVWRGVHDREECGEVSMTERLTIHARCPMRLSRYPMDNAICPLYIGSFGYSTREVVYHWLNNTKAVDKDPGVTMSQFEIGEIHFHNTTRANRLGEFSILCVYIHLSRFLGVFLLETYVPCYLIVSLSWVSFWINRDAAPARVLLGVTTILNLVALGMTVREGLPRVPYATAVDVFQYMCLVYAIAALIEYAAVNYFTKILPKEGGLDEEEEEEEEEEGEEGEKESEGVEGRGVLLSSGEGVRERETLLDSRFHVIDVDTSSPSPPCCRQFWSCLVGNFTYRMSRVLQADPESGNSVSHIDIICRRLFPSSFILLNLCYWLLYLYFDTHTNPRREKIITT